ncbi:glycosyltransferase family 92 protein [Flavobacterium anhuiense]|uniref:Glycosyltransferase family 92 n=1 Tax=Flavobacterium anhuiense TaxID=459526 RepID=A0ABY0LZP9_9FLAO|nr:glycosyltransferase family 92 protein [Flavobacterium anhuiense]SCY84852.1 Glycosyltransferase family 92 [Flavobacterium anhuiense]
MLDNQGYYVRGNFITRQRFRQTFLKNSFTRFSVYFFQSIFVFSLILLNRFFKKKTKEFKYSASICCIFKNEARYFDEWIRYHLVIGVDHFYLYNNNSDDNFLEVLQPYIEKGIVDLIEWPFNHSQMLAYEDCYKKYKNDTNWLAFIDVDEFVCPLATDNIKSWLESYKNYHGVAIYWKQFGSNGKLNHNLEQLVIEQYTQCWPKPSVFTKMFCNMNFPISEFENPHVLNSKVFGFRVPPINQYKNIMSLGMNLKFSFQSSTIQINHYWGKAYDSFVESKINRSDVYHQDDIKMAQSRRQLLRSHESMCTVRDYKIQRFLLYTKLTNNSNYFNFK